MARIPHSALTNTFDRVANALLDASGNVISRAEAKQVAQAFRAKGDGDAAFVLESAYAQADGLDSAKYAKTTGADIATIRQALVDALKAADGQGIKKANGLSKAEIDSLPEQFAAMAKTLVSMSKFEAAPKTPGPKSFATFEAGLEHAATLMNLADGGNGKLSAAEVQNLATQLAAVGRSTEALAVSNMYTIAKAQAGKGKTVTGASVDGVVAWAKKQIAKHDKGAPGFSNSEIAGLPTTWAALLRVGQMAAAGILKPTLPPAPSAPTESAAAAFGKLGTAEQFLSARAVSNSNVGGVAVPKTLSALPAAVQAALTKDAAPFVQEYEWDGRAVDVSYQAITMDDGGAATTVGYAAVLSMKDGSGTDISWKYLYGAQGNLLGRDFTGDLDTPKRGFLPRVPSTGDYYLESDQWTVTTQMSDPEFRSLFAATQSDDAAFLINLTRGYLAPNIFLYRRDETTNELTANAGQWQVGEVTRDGVDYHLCKWNDIDDNSHTLWFTKSGSDFELAVWNYDN